MHTQLRIFFAAILFLTGAAFLHAPGAAARADADAFIGTWEGTWTGSSTGKLEMTISKAADGKLSGSVSPRPDQGDGYTVPFKSVEVAAGKLTAKCDDPNGEVEITLTATVEGKSARGTYSVRAKADGSEVESGSWTATKK